MDILLLHGNTGFLSYICYFDLPVVMKYILHEERLSVYLNLQVNKSNTPRQQDQVKR